MFIFLLCCGNVANLHNLFRLIPPPILIIFKPCVPFPWNYENNLSIQRSNKKKLLAMKKWNAPCHSLQPINGNWKISIGLLWAEKVSTWVFSRRSLFLYSPQQSATKVLSKTFPLAWLQHENKKLLFRWQWASQSSLRCQLFQYIYYPGKFINLTVIPLNLVMIFLIRWNSSSKKIQPSNGVQTVVQSTAKFLVREFVPNFFPIFQER